MSKSVLTVMAAGATPTVCPYCKQPLTNEDAIQALRKSQADFEKRLQRTVEAEAAKRAAQEVERVRAAQEERVGELLDQLKAEREQRKQERIKLRADATRQAALEVENVRAALEGNVKALRSQLQAERDQRKQERIKLRTELSRELQDKAERKVNNQLRSLKQALEREVDEKQNLERRLENLTASERGSFSEDDLVRELKQAFPDDQIEKRGKGGDVLHEVCYRAGNERVRAGLIVYECKDTVTWNKSFVAQAREAAEMHHTPYAIVVSKAFPPKQKTLFVMDDVVVVHPGRVIDLVRVVRRMVVEVHRAGLSAEGQAHKTMLLHRYLTSEEFRQNFDGVIDVGERLKELLQRERKAHQDTWGKREEFYNELADRMNTIDQRIRSIIERAVSNKKAKVVRLVS